MTEPAPTYRAGRPQPLDETAVDIAAGIASIRAETVSMWIRAALAGTRPLRGTYGWDVWIMYQAAVMMRQAAGDNP